MINWLNGKKMYITAALILIYAGIGYFLKFLDAQSAINYVWSALGLIGLKSALTKLE